VGGAFIVETIFGWPGLGRLIVQAIFDRDYPVIVAAVILVAVIYQALNLATDLLQGALDPRVRSEAL
jgi:ABC-type dipeptide/oligopeptide/nickel transport system permease component